MPSAVGKRTSFQNGVPDFRPGNLIRVEMINFLTFSRTVFTPGPRMNLVIGPNGTGKSTVVSAVCIVFGGKPSILGRNPELSAFVKYGTDKSSVEAWLHEPKTNRGYISVKREFDAEGNSSFYINGTKVRQRDVTEKIVHKYDIQLDNLSQFMPQEKIAEFTNHKPEELLKLAIRSLGGAEKEDEYFTLVEEDGKLTHYTESLKKNQANLTKLTEEQENDHAEVVAYRRQQELRAEVELFRRFRPTVEEIETRFVYSSLRDQMRFLEKEVHALEADLRNRMSGPVNACKQAVNIAKNAYTSAKASTNQYVTRHQEIRDSLEAVTLKLVEKLKELRDVKTAAERARKSVEMAEMKLQQAQQAYEEVTRVSDNELIAQLDELNRRRSQLLDRKHDAERRERPLQEGIEQAGRVVKHFGVRLQGLADVKRQRMERLRGMRNGEMVMRVAQLVAELQRNNQFQRRVYGPVMAEVEVEDTYHARIMEHCVSGWLCTSFVTESARDSRTLLEECRRRFNGYKPDIMTTPTTRDDEIDYDAIQRQVPPVKVDTRLRQLGIIGTVNDIYRAPDAVHAALNAMAGLHKAYVGNEEARRNQETLRNESGIPVWYTPETRCSLSGSRYDPTVKNLRVDTSFMYVKGELYKGSMSETQRQRDEYSRRIREEEDKMEDLRRQWEEVRKEQEHVVSNQRAIEADIRGLTEQRSERRRKADGVAHARRHVDDMRERAARWNETRLRNELREKIGALESKSMSLMKEMCEAATNLTTGLEKMDSALLERTCAEKALSTEEAKHADASRTVAEKQKERNELREERDRMKEEWKRKKDIAQARISAEELEEQKDKLQGFMQRPLQDLDHAIENLEAQIQGLSSSGRGVIEAYEMREQKIEQLRKEIASQQEWFEKQHTDLSRRKDGFLGWLNEGINRMRVKFSTLYSRLGCSGDIQLLNCDGAHSLKDLTLQVLVSYRRDTELRPVSATANSGGEKMCCTMIFCFSLQLEHERIPPFIMVDELNQGLDPENEMKIMTMMIEDAATEFGAQSFVVTPKLLSNLPLGPCTKTHIVYNGPVRGK